MELQAILSYSNNGNMADLTCFRALRKYSIAERDKKKSMKSPEKCPIHQCQKTFLRDVKISTNKLQFHHEIMETERDIQIQVYMHSRFLCDIWLYGICDQWLLGHRTIQTQMAILKDGLKIIVSGLYDT
jgi:hypothetical protein